MAKLRKKNKKKFYGFILLLTLLILCGIAALGYFVFEIEQIQVEGSDRFSDEEIIALSGVQTGQNLFLVSKKQIKENIERQPYLQFTDLSYELPSTLILHVTEKKAYGAVPFDGQYAFIDEKGIVLQLSAEANNVPVVEGFGPTAATLGAQIQGPSVYQLYVFEQIMPRILEQSFAETIESIDVSQPAAVHLKTDTGMTIRIGNVDDLDTKISWLATLMPRLAEEGKLTGTLDVTGKSGASYVP